MPPFKEGSFQLPEAAFEGLGSYSRTTHSYPEGAAIVHDITPPNAIGQPLLVAQGFGIFNPVVGRSEVIASNRIRAITPAIDVAKGRGVKRDNKGYYNNFTPEILMRSTILANVAKEYGLQGGKGYGISGGALDLAMAALISDSFDHIVLGSPGAVELPPHVVVARWSLDKLQALKQNGWGLEGANTGEVAHYLRRNIPCRVGEIRGIAKANLIDVILKLNKKGVGVSAIVAQEDNLFRYSEMEAALKDLKDGGHAFPFKHYEVVPGGHEEPNDFSRTRIAMQMLR